MNSIESFSKNLFTNIKNSFVLINDKKEDIKTVVWMWGGISYLVAFIINKLFLIIKIAFIKWIIAALVIIYFIWHIVSVRRCTPKKPPLTPEEKEQLRKDRVNRFFRKLFLKEPLTTWNSSTFAIAIDLYIIVVFAEYLI